MNGELYSNVLLYGLATPGNMRSTAPSASALAPEEASCEFDWLAQDRAMAELAKSVATRRWENFAYGVLWLSSWLVLWCCLR